jgi:hypothetical protein
LKSPQTANGRSSERSRATTSRRAPSHSSL